MTHPDYALNEIAALYNHVQAHALTEGPKSQHAYMLARSRAWGDGWGTHVPLLASVVATARAGSVIELGAGYFSTPVLAEMCKAMGRKFYSYEEKADWAAGFQGICDDILLVDSWETFRGSTILDAHPAVVLIDNQPNYERVPNIDWAERSKAEFIVVHDTLQPPIGDIGSYKGMNARLDKFRYRSDYTSLINCTSVVSHTRQYGPKPNGKR